MAGFLVEAAKAIQGLQCQLLGANEYIVGSVGRYAGPVRDRALDGINATRKLLGCDPAEDVPPLAGPFEGGQCAGVNYQINWSWSAGSFNSGPQQTQRTGPLSFSRAGTGSEDCGPGGGTYNVFTVIDGTGSSPVSLAAGCQATLNSLTATRLDGLPDDCGNPPPETIPPPIDIDFDIDVTYQPDFGVEITAPITVNFKPTTNNFDGRVSFPFEFNLGGIDFNGSLSFDPEINVRINPPLRVPRGTGQPTDTLPPQTDPQPVEPAEFDRIIIGVAVQSTVNGEQQFTSITQTGQPSILAPRVGSIKFAYSIGIATFWSSDIDVKGANVFIPCPFSQGADAVVVSPAPGVAVTWQPVYGFPLATAEDVDSAAGIAVGA